MVCFHRFKISSADQIDESLYEVTTCERVFSYFVHSDVELLRGDIITVYRNSIGAYVVEIFRNGDVVYVHS